MNSISSGTTTGTIYMTGINVGAGESPTPQKAPKALIATRAIQTQAGWIGQVIVNETIIWESQPVLPTLEEDNDDEKPEIIAEKRATEHVLKAFVKMIKAVK